MYVTLTFCLLLERPRDEIGHDGSEVRPGVTDMLFLSWDCSGMQERCVDTIVSSSPSQVIGLAAGEEEEKTPHSSAFSSPVLRPLVDR